MPAKNSAPVTEKEVVSLFWDNASRLLEAALKGAGSGPVTESITVLIGAEGGIHLIAGADWPLERLRAERGAQAAYRIQHNTGKIELIGEDGANRCRLEAARPPSPALELLKDQPRYML